MDMIQALPPVSPPSLMVKNALMVEKKAQPKSAQLNIRLPEGGKEALQEAAARWGLSMSEFVRFLMFEEIRRHQRGEQPTPEMQSALKRAQREGKGDGEK